MKRTLALMLFWIFWMSWISLAIYNNHRPSEYITSVLLILLIKPILVTVLVFLAHYLGLLDEKSN